MSSFGEIERNATLGTTKALGDVVVNIKQSCHFIY
jgi:hypothetical protein